MDHTQTCIASRIFRFDTIDGRYFLVYDDPKNMRVVVEEYMSLDSRMPNKFDKNFTTLKDMEVFMDCKVNEFILRGYEQKILKTRYGTNEIKELDIQLLQKIRILYTDVELAHSTLQAKAYYNGVRMTINDIVTKYRETGELRKQDLIKMNLFYKEVSEDLDISRHSSIGRTGDS